MASSDTRPSSDASDAELNSEAKASRSAPPTQRKAAEIIGGQQTDKEITQSKNEVDKAVARNSGGSGQIDEDVENEERASTVCYANEFRWFS